MEQNELYKDSIIYASSNFPYQPLIRTKVYVKGKNNDDERFVANETITEPLFVTIYDHKEYLQIDLIFSDDERAPVEKAFNTFNYSVSVQDIKMRYPNHWIWVSTEIIPNPASKNVYLELQTTEGLTFLNNSAEKRMLVSYCTPTIGASVVTDNTPHMHYSKLSSVVEYNTISEHEKQFIAEKVHKQNQLVFEHKKFEKQTAFISKLFSSEDKKKKQASNNLAESLHMTEQEKSIFNPDILNISGGELVPETTLNNLIGLDTVKTEVKKLKAKLAYRKKQEERKIYTDSSASMHMCFTGSPGTGKTTVARIITGILYHLGYVKENKCVEVNGQNLKGGYTGQTAIITKLVLKSAKNRVLFIDEAYALFDDYESGFGKEAVATILKHMEDERDNTIVIFAGYKDDMEVFLNMNDGLKSRINRYIDFRNYNCEELTEILMSYLKKKKLYITEDALAKCILAFKKAETSERFSNGRFVRNMLEKIEYEHAYNTHNTKDTRRQDTIEVEDVPDELINELLTRSM